MNEAIRSKLKEYGLEGFLAIAIKVADFLGECHKAGIIHRNLPPEVQRKMVDKVKRSVSIMINDPITLEPDMKLGAALQVMAPLPPPHSRPKYPPHDGVSHEPP